MRPILNDVTLVAVTSVALEATVEALRASMRQASFGAVLLLSDQRPQHLDPAIRWCRIERLNSRADYSRFMLRELVDHIQTHHALCVQWDGFVLNGASWDPQFLDYDYIGAVWPQFDDVHNVGNGGFSLRSRRLFEACRELPFDGREPEDVVIGRKFRSQLEDQGIRFAPESVAKRFAYERTTRTGTEFGFHGAFNLVDHVSPRRALRLFRAIERDMLAKNERRELMWWALRRGRMSLALELLRRLS